MKHPSSILKDLGIRPRKSFGQNFLINHHTIEGVENFLDEDKTVLEIGPGLGMITTYLLSKNFSLVLSEKDQILSQYLKSHFQENIDLVFGDFLEQPVALWKEKKVGQVVSNLPFYITAPIITHIVSKLPFVETMVLGMQKEVAEKILAGEKNSLALYLKSQGEATHFKKMKRTSFFPVPEVDADWIIWKRGVKIKHLESFEVFLRGLYWGKRKPVKSSLMKNPFFDQHSFSQNWRERVAVVSEEILAKRPEELGYGATESLYRAISGDRE